MLYLKSYSCFSNLNKHLFQLFIGIIIVLLQREIGEEMGKGNAADMAQMLYHQRCRQEHSNARRELGPTKITSGSEETERKNETGVLKDSIC